MKKYLFFLIAFVLSLAGAANADFYTWEDEKGVTQITDYPPPQAQKGRIIRVYGRDYDQSSGLQDEERAAKAGYKPNITIYTKNDCADCDKARDFFTSKQLAFIEYNMDKDKTALERRKNIDNSDDVPFTIINKSQIYGFSETIFNRLLKLAP